MNTNLNNDVDWMSVPDQVCRRLVHLAENRQELRQLQVNKDEKVCQAYVQLEKKANDSLLPTIDPVEALPRLKKAGMVCASINEDAYEEWMRAAHTGDEVVQIYSEMVKPCTDLLEGLTTSGSSIVADFSTQYLDVFSEISQNMKKHTLR